MSEIKQGNTRESGGRSVSDPTNYAFTFHGSGSAYFRIWIVNLSLTILTLGVYSAWAKVRTNRYFYGCTELAGDTFEYHAQPIQILKGRLVAIAVFAVYALLQLFVPLLFSYVLSLVLLCFLPVIVVRSLRFRAVMSSWRGIRFGFQGSAWGAAKAYVLWPLFGVVTLGFGIPVSWHRQNQFAVGNHRFGTTDAYSTTDMRDFYAIFWVLLGLGIVGIVFVVSLAVGLVPNLPFPVVFVAVYFPLYAIYGAMYYRLVWDNIVLGESRTQSNVVTREWVGIVVTNSILLLLSLGLFYPWARVRLTRYMLSHTSVISPDLSVFVARTGEDESALGEEIGEAFDMGIGV